MGTEAELLNVKDCTDISMLHYGFRYLLTVRNQHFATQNVVEGWMMTIIYKLMPLRCVPFSCAIV